MSINYVLAERSRFEAIDTEQGTTLQRLIILTTMIATICVPGL